VAIEALLAYLEREAETETNRLLAESRTEAAAVEQRAAAEAARRRAAEADRLDREGRAAIRDALVSVRRDQRRRLLAARAGALDRIFTRADGILRTVPVERYRHRLTDLAAGALRYLEGCPASLGCPTTAASTVAPLAADFPGVWIAPDDAAIPGIIARADDGSVLVDNTLPEQLARRRPDLAIRLATRLTGNDALG
jgi:vacuolar-type H+-ATPase subunit E/Vma4